jgi:hypothetical protein
MHLRRKALSAGAPAMKMAVFSSMKDQFSGKTRSTVALVDARRDLSEERRMMPAMQALK